MAIKSAQILYFIRTFKLIRAQVYALFDFKLVRHSRFWTQNLIRLIIQSLNLTPNPSSRRIILRNTDILTAIIRNQWTFDRFMNLYSILRILHI